jgi:hypothetical protein
VARTKQHEEQCDKAAPENELKDPEPPQPGGRTACLQREALVLALDGQRCHRADYAACRRPATIRYANGSTP